MLIKEIERFVEEDLGEDLTEIYLDIIHDDTEKEKRCRADIISKDRGILAGLEEAKQIFRYFDPDANVYSELSDGSSIKEGEIVLSIESDISSILKGERITLNFLGRMSGIATLTNAFIEEMRKVNDRIKVAGTRKTTPGFRKYEKKAIIIGGGDPHRFALYDTIIIKDNLVKVIGLEEAIRKAKERCSFTRKIEIEVESPEDALKAAELNADIIMLDNMSYKEVEQSVRLLEEKNKRDKVILEVSGDITMENVRKFASTRVDVISIGMLTHSARWLDFSLEVI